jgi:hypothetical protein
MRDLFDTKAKTPGWDKREFDWDWFIEIKVANDSETPVTIENVEYRLRVGKRNQNGYAGGRFGYFLNR